MPKWVPLPVTVMISPLASEPKVVQLDAERKKNKKHFELVSIQGQEFNKIGYAVGFTMPQSSCMFVHTRFSHKISNGKLQRETRV